MAEAACHLVDNVLPIVPYRQFVITFPYPLRYWLNTNTELFGSIHHIILTMVPGGKVKLSLKRPFSDGSTHLIMTYGEFIEKLAALIPPPKTHLVRWSGSFAPNCKYRKKIVLNPEEKKVFERRLTL